MHSEERYFANGGREVGEADSVASLHGDGTVGKDEGVNWGADQKLSKKKRFLKGF
jgi:hypothetical protein